jgi:hypothetical protein
MARWCGDLSKRGQDRWFNNSGQAARAYLDWLALVTCDEIAVLHTGACCGVPPRAPYAPCPAARQPISKRPEPQLAEVPEP